jgi:hypothetical protein
MQMEPTTFLVREKGCDSETLRLQAGCLFGCVHIADQIYGLLIASGPTTEEKHGTIRLPCHSGLGERDAGARLDTPAHGIEAKGRALPQGRHLAPRTADRGPAGLVECVLEADTIAFTIASYHHPRTWHDHLLHLLDQSNREVFGKVALLACTHHPRQREGSPLIDHMDHQGYTSTSHDAAIEDEHQGLDGELREQERGIGEEVDLFGDRGVVDPSGKALDTAFGLGAIGDLRRAVGELGTLAGNDATDEGSQCGQVPGALPLGRTCIPWCQGSPYGTILAEVVTPRTLLLF